nr:hypothetical protein [Neorhizobium tomejilense]
MQTVLNAGRDESSGKKITGLVTVFCDVSYCPDSKAAGYGAWYRTDAMDKGVFFGGQVPVPCASSNDGEFWGLALSLYEVFKRLGGAKPDAIVLQCDNIAALGWVRRFHPLAEAVGDHHGTHAIPNGPAAHPANMEIAIETVKRMDPTVRIWLKHVKGHDRKSKTARSWVNKQCDANAREHMLARRAVYGRRLRRA